LSTSKGVINILQEFSIPLIVGVLAAVVFANLDQHSYHAIVEYGPLDALCANSDGHGTFCQAPHGAHDATDSEVGHEHSHDGDAHEGDPHAPAAHDDAAAGHSTDAEPDNTDEAAAAAAAIAGEPNDLRAPDHGTIKPVFSLFGHHLTLHFLINDIFMLFFFGVAAKEITESVLPGGDLNPPSKAINPLLATIGGVVGPVGCYLLLTYALYGGADAATFEAVRNGWGIPTATDIALAWLIARIVFGGSHPAVNFLLLLAIADDAIGLGIIAIFYPNPDHPVAPQYLLMVVAGMGVAFALRKKGVQNWVPYIAIGGTLSWLGLLNAALHPALALVPIVPFLPGPKTDTGLFRDDDEADLNDPTHASHDHAHSPLHNFEHSIKLFVDFGLFFFGFANAGVEFSAISDVTWIVLASLIVGKTVGITFFAMVGSMLGFKLPEGMSIRHVVVAGLVAGVGLTVALFVAGEAFPGGSPHQGPAKMGALLSFFSGVLAIIVGRIVKANELDK
jgi:NhaA family Na+:H+ antiporter